MLDAADLAQAALSSRTARSCAEVLEAAAHCETVFGRQAAEIRLQAAAMLLLGSPPSMRQIVGVSDLEVPMNRALAWVFDERSRGVVARKAVMALATLLDFPQLEQDIAAGDRIVLYAESSPDTEISSRQPDFLIGTTNAAVLVENKVWSPESGPDQYAHYLEMLRSWAKGRGARAYLLARDESRATPPGWERSISHRELADAFRPLTVDATISFWDRVVYALILTDLDPDPIEDRLVAMEQLMGGGHGLSEVSVATKLSQLLRRPAIDPNGGKQVAN